MTENSNPVAEAFKDNRRIFVIMPFAEANARSATHLDSFFAQLKGNIEAFSDLQFRYLVFRSGSDLEIVERIITDLLESDIVICDLSGHQANPNVMFELGVRFAVSAKPVILIREESDSNKAIFDIQHMYIHAYDSKDYLSLFSYLKGKLGRIESGEEVYESPIFRILGKPTAPISESSVILAITQLNEADASLALISVMLLGAMRWFLKFHYKIEFEYNYDIHEAMLSKVFADHFAELNELDWSGFHWQVGSLVFLEDIARNRTLDSLLPDYSMYSLRMTLMTFLLNFTHNKGLAQQWSYRSLQGFSTITDQLRQLMTMYNNCILITDSHERTELIQTIDKALSACTRNMSRIVGVGQVDWNAARRNFTT